MSGLARPELDPAWYVDREENVSLEEFCNIEDLDACLLYTSDAADE